MAKNLVDIIHEDKLLKGKKKTLFSTMAVEFEANLFENIDKTSMELFADYRHVTESPSDWQKFLRHKPVEDYIRSFRDEKIAKAATESMTKGMRASEAVKVSEHLEKHKVKEDNSNIVVMLMPQKSSWGDQ